MPIDDAKFKETMNELSMSLARQSIARQEMERSHARETAQILKKFKQPTDELPDLQVEDIGAKFLSTVANPPHFISGPGGSNG
jgi:hypothetical protein